jgi:hypothetical protein
MAQVGSAGADDVDNRQWGPDHWWQNTRLPYWNMLAAGDADSIRVVLDWVSGFIPLAIARTAAVLPPPNAGIFFTEVSDISGLYQGGLYGCTDDTRAGEPEDHSAAHAPTTVPVWNRSFVMQGTLHG